jgi:hypothetical protein
LRLKSIARDLLQWTGPSACSLTVGSGTPLNAFPDYVQSAFEYVQLIQTGSKHDGQDRKADGEGGGDYAVCKERPTVGR